LAGAFSFDHLICAGEQPWRDQPRAALLVVGSAAANPRQIKITNLVTDVIDIETGKPTPKLVYKEENAVQAPPAARSARPARARG
jgi:hypothetical protein